MGRKLKHHEKLLLKKHNFYFSKRDTNTREQIVMRRYHIEDRMDYQKYNRLVGRVTQIAHKLKDLGPNDEFRIAVTNRLLDKLYSKGVISNKNGSLQEIEDKLCVSSFCRRRLPVMLVSLKMAENVKVATLLIQHGHIRVGPEVVRDPAFLVPRAMEDHITWVDGSKIKRTISKYNDKLDDFDLLGA